MTTERWLTIQEGIRIRALVTGRGSQPLLLVHGWVANALDYWPLLEHPELQRRYEIIAIDLPSHGRSGPLLHAPMSPYNLASMVASYIQEAELGPLPIVGHSLGGAIVLTMAVNHRMARHMTRTVALVPPLTTELAKHSVLLRMLSRPGLGEAIWQPWLRWMWHGAFVANIIQHEGLFDPFHPALPIPVLLRSFYQRCTVPSTALAPLRQSTSIFEHLADLQRPALIVYGDHDPLLETMPYERLAHDRPSPLLNIQLLAGAGHAMNHARPDEVAGHILRFLDAELAPPKPCQALPEPSSEDAA